MNKVGKIWLAFLLIPFLIGVLLFIYIPLHIILSTNPKLQQNFNGYKIQTQLNTVRAMAFFNSRVLRSRLQMPLNILSTLIHIINQYDIDHVVNLTNINLNNAYSLANLLNQSDFIKQKSMWYSNRVLSTLNMNSIQTNIFNTYLQAEPLIRSTFSSNDQIFSSITKFQITINCKGEQLYFTYPSYIQPQFGVENASILNEYYFNTIRNQKQTLIYITLFDLGTQIKACMAFYYANQTQLNAVACIDISIQIFVNDTRTLTNVTTIQLSTYDYYFVRPMYQFQNLSNPQIIANFSTSDLSKLNKPTKQYFQLRSNNLTSQFFKVNRNYTMKVQRFDKTKTYFVFPVIGYDFNQCQNITLYMILLNNFAKAQLLKQSRNQRISILIIVPSVVLVFISTVVTFFVLRVILKKLQKTLKLLEQYCSLIKRGDLELQISYKNDGAADLEELFDKIRILNQLNKYSNNQYFNVSKPQRIIKLLKCSKLFQELNYNRSNLYQNISECYVSIADYDNALKFMRMSIDTSLKDTYGRISQIDTIYDAKVNKRFKAQREFRKKQNLIKRKILRLCQILNMSQQISQNKELQAQIMSKAELLRKIVYPDILNYEYIGCLMFIISFKIKNKDFSDIESKMQILQQLIKGYQQINENIQNCRVAPYILYSYWYSMMGGLHFIKQKYVEAYQYYVCSLSGNRFNPQFQIKVYRQIKRVLDMNNIQKKQLATLKFTDQYLPRRDREYIFLIDISNPNANIIQINKWKNKGRKMAETIFNTLVTNNDRVSIVQFCLNIKIICNLVQKTNRQKLIKKQLINSFKTREQAITAYFISCLNKAVERVRNLKKQKVFIIFLKNGEQISCREIQNQIRYVENCQVILIVEDAKIISDKTQNIYVVELEDIETVNRILQQKVLKYADNMAYIF